MRLGGVTEVAGIVNVSRQRLSKLRERPDFPDPIGELAQGPIWDLDAVEAWQTSGLRSAPGRPSAETAAQTLGGRFVLEPPKIGEGGFADVYRAIDKKAVAGRSGWPVAVKVLRDIDAVPLESKRRFARELRILEGLDHPHVVSVLGHGETDEKEGLWYAMPLAQGSLVDLLPSMLNDHPRILELMREVCSGLSFIHARGVLHRDLKPGNILRTAEDTWAIADFGLAVEAERQTTILTSTLRAGLGSWCYTAPEQFLDARSSDERSDIYSLGKVLQQTVTGVPPFTNEMPASPLRPVVEKATAQRPDARYRTAEEFVAAVERALGEIGDRWETAEDVAKRLLERVRLARPQIEDLVELLNWGLLLDEHDIADMEALSRVLPRISGMAVAQLWLTDPEGFRRLYLRYADYVGSGGFGWDYCDVVADFGIRAADKTKDPAILRATVQSLVQMGYSHNRWHVRSVLVEMLQGIRSAETAAAAADGLRSAGRDDVEWVFNDFTVRSLHPTLRAGVLDYIEEVSA